MVSNFAIRRSQLFRLLRNLKMDLKYGGEFLGGVQKTKYGVQGARDTANTDYGAMPFLFDDVVKENDVVADIGSGKGRVLNYFIHKFPANKVYGLELDPDCAAGLRRRLRKYRNLEIISGNACESIPPDVNIFYLFNPFSASVMAEFKASLEFTCKRRPLKIIYYNPVCKSVFAEDPKYVMQDIDLPSNFHRAVLIKTQ